MGNHSNSKHDYLKTLKSEDLSKIFIVPVRERSYTRSENSSNQKLIRNLRVKIVYLAKSLFISTLIGVVVALFQPMQFQSDTVILPEYARSIGYVGNLLDSRIGSLLTTISTSTYRGRTDAIRIDLYPALMKSNIVLYNVLNKKMDIPINGSQDNDLSRKTTFEYLENDLNRSFTEFMENSLSRIQALFYSPHADRSSDAEMLVKTMLSNQFSYFTPSAAEEKALWQLKERISATYDESTGAFILSVKMPDASVAAIISKMILDETHQLITEYQKEKFRLDYAFLEREMMNAKVNMDQKRLELSDFIDRNNNQYSATLQSVQFQKEYDFNLAKNIYKSYLFQVEESKLKSTEETPLFTYLSPTSVSNKPLFSEFWNTIFLFMIIGTIVSLLWKQVIKR